MLVRLRYGQELRFRIRNRLAMLATRDSLELNLR